MGIGTSLGAYFEDTFQHQAGVPTLPKGDEESVKKPKDTGDDNVLPPDEGTYDQPTKGLTRVVITKPDKSEDVRPEPDYLNPPEGNFLSKSIDDFIPNVPNRLSILNAIRGTFHGAEDAVKNSPRHLIDSVLQPLQTVKDVSEGKVPMMGMDPDTGEMHTTLEGMQSAWSLLPYGIGGRMPTIQLRGPAVETLNQVGHEATAHDQFQQLLRQVRRQPSNITQDLSHIDDVTLERAFGEMGHPSRLEPGTPAFDRHYGYEQTPFEPHQPRLRSEYHWDIDEGPEGPPPKDIDLVPQHLREGVEQAQNHKEVKLFKAGTTSYGEGDKFVFANKDGIGEMRLSERRNGRDLYVNWIGTVRGSSDKYTHTFGGMKMKEVIRQLMDIYPHAETISGFRVSGVRGMTGANEASVKLPGRGPKKSEPPRKTEDEMRAAWDAADRGGTDLTQFNGESFFDQFINR